MNIAIELAPLPEGNFGRTTMRPVPSCSMRALTE